MSAIPGSPFGRLPDRAGAVLLLLASLAQGAGFDNKAWKYRTPLRVLEPGRLCVVPFDRTLYARARRDLADIRVVGGTEEVPFIIETLAGSVEQHTCLPAILNKSVIPETGVQITLDLEKCKELRQHSRITFTTPEANFRQRVRIEASDDNRFWLVSREDGYIFDFSQGDRKLSVLSVDYPVSTRRFVRATIFGWTDTSSITGARSYYRVERPAERYILDAITPERTEDAATRSSLLTLDLGQSGLPHDRIRLEADRSDFHRATELEASDDGKIWRMVTRATIFRVREETSLAITYPQRYERYLRLRIFNGDNRPAPVQRVYVETLQRLLEFLPNAPGDFWLYYGNPQARPPVYDLVSILGRQSPMPRTTPVAGEWKINPDYQAPAEAVKPWSERYPGVLYGVLGIAVLAMGVVTVRFMLKVKGA
ncbi:MAG TPA: DUF3999 family protein [Bryobacteraceae bacterium]|nr:DUF3999 family protein [Bryobacteraceae bacterium]